MSFGIAKSVVFLIRHLSNSYIRIQSFETYYIGMRKIIISKSTYHIMKIKIWSKMSTSDNWINH